MQTHNLHCRPDNSFRCPQCDGNFAVSAPEPPNAENSGMAVCPLCGVFFAKNIDEVNPFLRCPACHAKFKYNTKLCNRCKYCGQEVDLEAAECPGCHNRIKTVCFSFIDEQTESPHIDSILEEAEKASRKASGDSSHFSWKNKLLLGFGTMLAVICVIGSCSISSTPRNTINKAAQLCKKNQCADAVATGYDIFVKTRHGQLKANAPRDRLIPFWITSENGRNAMPGAMLKSLENLIDLLQAQNIGPFSTAMSRQEAFRHFADTDTEVLKQYLIKLGTTQDKFNFAHANEQCSCFLEILKLTASRQ